MSDSYRKYFVRVVCTIAFLLWLWLIFSMSNDNATDSAATSGGFTKTFLSVFYPVFKCFSAEHQQEILQASSHFVRKSAHFFLYFVLSGLSFGMLTAYTGKSRRFRAGIAVGFCALYAISDEIHQIFIPGRSGEVKDVLLDTFAAGVMAGLILLIGRLRDRKKSR